MVSLTETWRTLTHTNINCSRISTGGTLGKIPFRASFLEVHFCKSQLHIPSSTTNALIASSTDIGRTALHVRHSGTNLQYTELMII
jgi:hypothetical protein